jgi:3-hydroxyisobutyrate dehydrogenase-like beta-hydroxyacid dehydrogenase
MIGYIGLGHMGGAIARRLLESGIELIVFDVNPDASRGLADVGATVATSVREVADRAEFVLVCLPSPQISIEVAREAAEGKRAQIYVEMSTIGRRAIAAIADIFADTTVTLVDAPVTGGPRAASLGALTVIMAGPVSSIDRLKDALGDSIGNILTVGEKPGQAQLCKLVNNAIAFTAFLVSCEAISVGVSGGIDPSVLVNVINTGSGRNSGTTDKFPQSILPGTFNSGASLGSGIKDMDLYLGEASAAGMPPTIVASTRETWIRALGVLDPAKDFTTIIRYFEKLVGAEVAGTA